MRNQLRKPNLFIVGAPKAGTTALHYFLKQHPDVFMAEQKEIRFFAKDVWEKNDQLYKNNDKRYPSLYVNYYFQTRKEKDYLRNFADWKNEKIAGESSPGYFYSKVAAKSIHKFNPAAKIIMIIRDPVDRVYSQYHYRLWSGSETVYNFKEALEKNPELYGAELSAAVKRYLNLFDRNQVNIIIFDDFKRDNAKICREVFQFLGIDSNFTPKFDFINVTETPRFKRFHNLLKFSALTKLFVTPKYILPPKLSSIYARTTRFVFSAYKRLFTVKQAHPSMDPRLRRELMKKVKPDVKKLSRIVNRDLVTLWGYDKV